jgi:hypothetical protein
MEPMAFPLGPGASPLGLTGAVGGVNAEAELSTGGAKVICNKPISNYCNTPAGSFLDCPAGAVTKSPLPRGCYTLQTPGNPRFIGIFCVTRGTRL